MTLKTKIFVVIASIFLPIGLPIGIAVFTNGSSSTVLISALLLSALIFSPLLAWLTQGRYYMARQLPATALHLARIESGAETVMALTADAF